MKRLLLLLMFLTFAITAQAQEKICVEQAFINDATKAFELVAQHQKTVEEFLKERAKTQAEREAAITLIASYDELVKIKDLSISSLEKLNKIYENVIRMQSEIIDKLEKRLLKPRSFTEKFLQFLKETALIVGGIVIGRGL